MQILDDVLSGGTVHGDEISYDCPFCVTRGKSPDTEEKLWVNYRKQLGESNSPGCFFCYRCEAKGSLDYLYRHLGIDGSDQGSVSENYARVIRYLTGVQEPTEEAPRVVDYTTELLSMGCMPIAAGTRYWNYLIDRGVDPDDIRFYQMLAGAGRYHDRVVVPTIDFVGGVPFFVARAIKPMQFTDKGTGKKVDLPKYLNPKGEGRKWSIFNLNNAVKNDQIIVTEGVFSSIAAGRNAVATFGKLVTRTQLALLQAYGKGKELIVAFDADAHAECVNLASRLKRSGIKTSFVLLPEDHDPATLSKSDLLYVLENRYPYSDTAVLRLQLEGTFKCRTLKPEPVAPSLTKQFKSSIAWLQQGS